MLLEIAPSEFLVIAGAAIIFIGPKDMPRALRMAGRWFAKMRRVSNHFRAGIENMIREAEMEELQKEWAERNAAIVAAHPGASAMPDTGGMTDAMSGAHLATPAGHTGMPDYAGAKPPAAPPPFPATDASPAPSLADPAQASLSPPSLPPLGTIHAAPVGGAAS